MRPIAALLVLVAWLAAAGSASAELRRTVTVDGEAVRLGDLFDFAGTKSGAVVAAAPRPGQTEIYDRDRLRALAQRFQLDWPAAAPDRIAVERASRLVEPDEIAAALRTALQARGVGADDEIEIDGRTRRIYAASEARAALRAYDASVDQRTGRFTATLAIPVGPEATEPMTIGGRVVQTAEAAVPTRDVALGEILAPEDVRTIRVRRDQVQRTVLTDVRELIGKATKRPLREGALVRTGDVRDPVMVAKGSIVTIYFQTPRLLLTAKGRANQDGALGDVVAVVNTQSSKTVEGVVTGPDQIQIPSGAALGQ